MNKGLVGNRRRCISGQRKKGLVLGISVGPTMCLCMLAVAVRQGAEMRCSGGPLLS